MESGGWEGIKVGLMSEGKKEGRNEGEEVETIHTHLPPRTQT